MKKALIVLALLVMAAALQAAETPVARWSVDATPTEMAPVYWEDDGVFLQGTAGGSNALMMAAGEASYVYFTFRNDLRQKVQKDGCMVVEYYSSLKLPQIVRLNMNTPDEDYAITGAFLARPGGWKTAVCKYQDFVPVAAMNGGADFRIFGTEGLFVRKVELYNGELSGETLKTLEKDKQAPPVVPVDYPLGIGVYHVPPLADAQIYKELGITALENYVTWSSVENDEKGKWDWSLWDDTVSVLKAAGLKWAPALMVAPAYTLPDWYTKSDEFVPNTCLEHGTAGKTVSLWCPDFPKYVERFMKEFAARYGKTGILEAVYPGIQGDFGEAIYTVEGNQVIYNITGEYHNHRGFWCNDKYALASFIKFARDKYKTVEALNKAWNMELKDFDSVRFPFYSEEEQRAFFDKKETDPTVRRYFLDFVYWYRNCMTEYADWWLGMAKKYLPDTRVFLKTGGLADPTTGASFADQCRVAAKNKAGVRITNEASDYGLNFAYTNLVGSASRYYGCEFGYEPAGPEDENGIVARIYNSTCSGAQHLFDYNANIVLTPERMAVQQKHLKYLFQGEPIVPIAMFFPNTYADIHMYNKRRHIYEFSDYAAKLRDAFDYDFVDETMLDALKNYKLLVIVQADILENSTAAKIAEYARNGGRVLVLDGGVFTNPEGTKGPERVLFPKDSRGGAFGKGSVTRYDTEEALFKAIHDTLPEVGEPTYDIVLDGVYVSRLAGDRYMLYNSGDKDKELLIDYHGTRYNMVAPAHTIMDGHDPEDCQDSPGVSTD